ncbi:hypothetical protein [Microbulbifer rhizosphaerae]|uniref:Uncharacterized protein n=1 Tax=Microbulbifer rhizosphaerae TaxID=1562603 RepID=A0A7W4ZAQ2_9GAMM|nr:hypothetical protein [Microbulbifer rhizosphaerae]MBB3063058.1 hypothetical protein [Microbulbifer rhizosphaerae]
MKLLTSERLNLVIAVCAVLISGASFYATYLQANAAEKQVRAMTLPLVRFEHSNYSGELQRPLISFNLRNAGVGPAIVESILLEYKGETYHSIDDFLSACCREEASDLDHELESLENQRDYKSLAENDVGTNPLTGTVIPGQSSYVFVSFLQSDLNGEYWKKLNEERWYLTIKSCYCSLLGECYWSSSNNTAIPTELCPSDS